MFVFQGLAQSLYRCYNIVTVIEQTENGKEVPYPFVFSHLCAALFGVKRCRIDSLVCKFLEFGNNCRSVFLVCHAEPV